MCFHLPGTHFRCICLTHSDFKDVKSVPFLSFDIGETDTGGNWSGANPQQVNRRCFRGLTAVCAVHGTVLGIRGEALVQTLIYLAKWQADQPVQCTVGSGQLSPEKQEEKKRSKREKERKRERERKMDKERHLIHDVCSFHICVWTQ